MHDTRFADNIRGEDKLTAEDIALLSAIGAVLTSVLGLAGFGLYNLIRNRGTP